MLFPKVSLVGSVDTMAVFLDNMVTCYRSMLVLRALNRYRTFNEKECVPRE
jgi:hypothetical protein